jgi:hypothetical protein
MKSDKKTALLLIPEIQSITYRKMYLVMCIEKVTEEGYIPLTPALYESTAVNQEEFINKILPFVDAVYLYVNFGIDKPMFNVIDRIIGKIELRYRRITESKIDQKHLNPSLVLLDVCNKTGLTPEALKGKTRKREVVDARHVYFRRCREVTKASLSEIGSVVYRDHSTVLHGINEARNNNVVKALYERFYGEKLIKSTSQSLARDIYILPVENPVLPYRAADPRERNISSGEQFMLELSGREYYTPFSGYRLHSK